MISSLSVSAVLSQSNKKWLDWLTAHRIQDRDKHWDCLNIIILEVDHWNLMSTESFLFAQIQQCLSVFYSIRCVLRNKYKLHVWKQHRSDKEVSPAWLKTEWVSPAAEVLSTAVMVRGADQPWLLRPPLTVSPLLVSTPSWCWAFWLLWLVVGGAVRPWVGLLRPRPGTGAVVAAEGAGGAVGITWSRVGLFRKGSRLGLLRPGGKPGQRSWLAVLSTHRYWT